MDWIQLRSAVQIKNTAKLIQLSSLFSYRGSDPRPVQLSVQYGVVDVIADGQQG